MSKSVVMFVMDYCLYFKEDVIVLYGNDMDTIANTWECMKEIMRNVNKTVHPDFYDWSICRGDEALQEKYKMKNKAYYHDKEMSSIIVFFETRLPVIEYLKLIDLTKSMLAVRYAT